MIRRAIWTARAQAQSLDESQVATDPMTQFEDWFRQVKKSKLLPFPNAMNLCTVSPDGVPSARVVLMKDHGPDGLIFYTNYHSHKGREIEVNPQVSLNFYWPFFERQVRFNGKLEKVNPDISDAYFGSRNRGSQTGAWASQQSQPVSGREEMKKRFREIDAKYKGQPVPRPPHWGGYLLSPERVEFWQGRPNRYHDRIVYEKEGQGGSPTWKISRLWP